MICEVVIVKISMLRIRRRYTLSENNKGEATQNRLSDSDVKVEDSTNVFMSQKQTSSSVNRTSVNATEYSATYTRSHKKKKRLRSRNVSSSDNNVDVTNGSVDANPGIAVAAKKAKTRNYTIVQSTNVVIQPTENLRHAETKKTKIKKKLHGAGIEDSGRKKRKQEFDFDSNKVQATVLRQKTASDSIGESSTSYTDPLATSSKSSCDLQGVEDLVADDYVSKNKPHMM